MDVSLFDFTLPEASIALRPVHPRDSARMLVVRPDGLTDQFVSDLPSLLRPGDVLVHNDTRVIPARLDGIRVRGESVTRVEVMLHKRESADSWLAFARPGKRIKVGERIRFGAQNERYACELASLDAEIMEKGEGGEVLLRFSFSGPALDEAIARFGHMPLPPYIASKRAEDAADLADYQTIYARNDGAVAAPTAGLHFTDDLTARLVEAGIERRFVTLHVGAGTFLPVKADDTRDHKMHAEVGVIDQQTADALNAARARGGRIIATGTTALRLLESAARDDGTIAPFTGETSIFITPGYRFKAVDMLMTNFHLPRSTLFMLVSAFAGLDAMQEAYRHAIETGYRFYSYGDSSLLYLNDGAKR
ncbi:tRNA preQ1(34) S-adenosylmethionine ribosyltransferase-isomerase QueA [Pseudochelatococcus sp. G4_1912]|uniref:tRNA preQ1(34) S-adenosylmethionine ribosyltransferase-isomerase QueA n=1 Tax=Pseudochelatococcus sp. G4_1912 TaxID=3114288 RepID=UPI0039C7587E